MIKKSKTSLLLTLNLEHCSIETVIGLLKATTTDGTLLDQIAKLRHRDQALMEMLISHPRVMPQTFLFLYSNASADFKKRIQAIKKEPVSPANKGLVPYQGLGIEPVSTEGGIEKDHPTADKETLYQRIQKMPVAEKVQFALRAGKDARSLLLKDPNRQVSQAVLASPKITEDEILLIAQSRNVSDDILRSVGKNKEWLKNYSILFALIANPKTPVGISVSLLGSVKVKDLGLLVKNRNIPEAVRSGAQRLLYAKQKQS
ncbi:MAG: hypothetical protein HY203_03120 [Nitrospirae bacterium]|nr:hypothetical protein [Nitrospirota bacterium]